MLKIFKNHYFSASIILVAFLIVAFNNIVFLGKTLTTSSLTVGTTRNGPYLYNKNKPLLPITDGGASAWHFEPAVQLNNQAFKKGELPLWNPYNGAGQPLAADMQSSSFSPLTLPLNLNPTPIVWDIFLLLRLLIAGLLTFSFLKLINIKPAGAIAGAITFMFSGYLIFFINMAHLNVEILLPLMLIAVEYIHRKTNLLSIFFLAFSSALVILGGMPEAAVLNFGFALAYFIYRSFQEYKENKKGLQILTKSTYLLIGMIAGLMISSIGWLPFLEYSQNFWSNHLQANKGIIFLNPRHIIQYLSPVFIGVRNATYVGVIPLFLSIVTKKEHKQKWFFAIAATLIGLKLFGIGVNWLGYLPLINRVFFFKYGQVLFAFSISALTAIAIDSGLKTSFFRVTILVPIWIGTLYYFLANVAKLFNVKQLRLDYYASLSVKWALLFLAISVFLIIAPRIFKKIKVNQLAIAATLLIFLELWAHIPPGRAVRHNPYIAPPFIKYLQKQRKTFRTYALHALMWPNTNAPYKIQDIRSLNAIQPNNYMKYLSLFCDLRKRGHITGMEGINLDSQFFDALNVRYVLALKPLQKNLYHWLDKEKISKMRSDKEVWYKTPFVLNMNFPLDAKYLNFKTKTATERNLKIEAIPLGEEPITLFTKRIKSGKNIYRADISAIAGKFVNIKFNSEVLINSLHLTNGANLNEKFKPVFYDNKVRSPVTVYENKTVMPRITVVDKTVFAIRDKTHVLKKLNIRKEALVETKIKFNNNKKLKYKAEIKNYEPQRIDAEIKTNKKSLLILADTYFPGWKAYVNGKESKIFKTNIMFRGVIVNSKTKKVTFKYEPDSYKTSLNLLGFGSLLLFGLSFSEIIVKRKGARKKYTIE